MSNSQNYHVRKVRVLVIQGKSKQHFNKNISTTDFINLCQHLQFIYSA